MSFDTPKMFDLFSLTTVHVMDIIIIMITCFQRNQGGQEHTTAGKKKILILIFYRYYSNLTISISHSSVFVLPF